MNCKYKNKYKMIADYIAGDLQEPAKTELEVHLFECDECFQKAKIIENTILLIRAEGADAVVSTASASGVNKVKSFFSMLIKAPIPRFATVALLFVAALTTFSAMKYRAEIEKTFAFDASITLYNYLREYRTEQVSDAQLLDYYFTSGLTAFQNKEYEDALLKFKLMHTTLQRADGLSSEVRKTWHYKIQLYLGATKVLLWEDQKPGYFKWLTMKMRSQEFDKTLLVDAEDNLSAALNLAGDVHADLDERQKLDALLAAIQEQIKSP